MPKRQLPSQGSGVGRTRVFGLFALLTVGAPGCTLEADLGGVVPLPCADPCEGRCVDHTNTRSHCGRCGLACRDDEACEASRCVYPWPTRWMTRYRENFQGSTSEGWLYAGGACARSERVRAPDRSPALLFRPDWIHLRAPDPSAEGRDRAWVWRVWFEPPGDRAWALGGCIRSRVTDEFGALEGAVCFSMGTATGGAVRWSVRDVEVASSPAVPQGRWVEFRAEISRSRQRARGLVDGRVVWEGPIDDGDWEERSWWTFNVWREGYFEGCNTGRFLLSEVRLEEPAP